MQRLLLHHQAILSVLGVSLWTIALLELPAVALPAQQLLISQSQTARQYFDSARDKAENGDYQGAIADATQAIQIDPNKAHYYHVRAEARTQMKKPNRSKLWGIYRGNSRICCTLAFSSSLPCS